MVVKADLKVTINDRKLKKFTKLFPKIVQREMPRGTRANLLRDNISGSLLQNWTRVWREKQSTWGRITSNKWVSRKQKLSLSTGTGYTHMVFTGESLGKLRERTNFKIRTSPKFRITYPERTTEQLRYWGGVGNGGFGGRHAPSNSQRKWLVLHPDTRRILKKKIRRAAARALREAARRANS